MSDDVIIALVDPQLVAAPVAEFEIVLVAKIDPVAQAEIVTLELGVFEATAENECDIVGLVDREVLSVSAAVGEPVIDVLTVPISVREESLVKEWLAQAVTEIEFVGDAE